MFDVLVSRLATRVEFSSGVVIRPGGRYQLSTQELNELCRHVSTNYLKVAEIKAVTVKQSPSKKKPKKELKRKKAKK